MKVQVKKLQIELFSQRTFYILGAGIVILAIAYIYFVNNIVWNVASRQNAEKKLAAMTTSIATLESSYMKQTSSININQAYALGFQKTSVGQTTFVHRAATLGVLPGRKIQ